MLYISILTRFPVIDESCSTRYELTIIAGTTRYKSRSDNAFLPSSLITPVLKHMKPASIIRNISSTCFAAIIAKSIISISPFSKIHMNMAVNHFHLQNHALFLLSNQLLFPILHQNRHDIHCCQN